MGGVSRSVDRAGSEAVLGEQLELTTDIVEHVRWGLQRAVDDPDIPEIRLGTVHELSLLTCQDGSDMLLIKEERLRRRLLRPGYAKSGTYDHRDAASGGSGPIAMMAWEYVLLCFRLAISTNPYVETDHDRSNGVIGDLTPRELELLRSFRAMAPGDREAVANYVMTHSGPR